MSDEMGSLQSINGWADSRLKVIGYDEDGPGFYTIGILKISYQKHRLLDDAGWPDEFTLFLKMDGGRVEGYFNPRDLANEIGGHDDDTIKTFLVELCKSEGFTLIKDDVTYSPEDMEQILEDNDGLHY